MGFNLTTNSTQYRTDLFTSVDKIYQSEINYRYSELCAILFISGIRKMAIMRMISESVYIFKQLSHRVINRRIYLDYQD